MNGGINNHGNLFIERVGINRWVDCPYKCSGNAFWFEPQECGQRCPHFGEPVRVQEPGYESRVKLEICNNKILLFDKFVDER